jgi:hypothetical protein
MEQTMAVATFTVYSSLPNTYIKQWMENKNKFGEKGDIITD